MATVERYDDKRGDAAFRIVAANGRTLSRSSEGYRKKKDREHCIKESLSALIADYGDEGMKELGWVRAGADPREPEALDVIRSRGGLHDVDALAMYMAFVYEVHILSDRMVELLHAAGVNLDIYGQCTVLERFEIIRAAISTTNTRPGEVFGRDDALKAYWILTGE